ncbi:hypothetical protein QQF64_022319 [Cirrhinus molitorella]|uniref:Uncharacterized protein n=1 Tax=Cirrhinus molitorella TaxID=172907 RepID=A0ABR3LA78_9TELE
MFSTCMVPTLKHRGGGVMVWGCFAGDTVGTTASCSDIPSHPIPSGRGHVKPFEVKKWQPNPCTLRCSYPRLPSSQPQPNDTSVNSEGSVQNSKDSKDSPYAI